MKASLDELAIFGGAPAFPQSLFVGRPNIGDRERLRLRLEDLLERRWLSNGGPFVQDFEQRVAALCGVRHCIATCNGTIALEIAIRALGLSGQVIIPSFTFIATAHALQWQEITPLFCDIDPRTCTIDPARVEALLTPRTTGIIGVHLWGRSCDVEALVDIAHRRNLKLIFDAAHALGCTHRGRPIGSFGNAEIFSFHATKFLNSFEGGAVTTDDTRLAERIRLMVNFGFADYDTVVSVGTNGKMSEIAAAMGLTSLESMAEFVAHNLRNYELYRRNLSGIPGVSLREHGGEEHSNYQYIVAEIDGGRTTITRDQLQQVLWAENVVARRYFYPGCHRAQPYLASCPDASQVLPETERMAARVLSLPTGTAIGPSEIDEVSGIIRLAVDNGRELAGRLKKAGSAARPVLDR